MFPKQIGSGVDMRRISMGTRDELLEAVAARYRAATRTGKGRILTKFVEISGYDRNHAERLPRREHAVNMAWTGRGPGLDAGFVTKRCERRLLCSGKRATGSAGSG